MNAADTLKHWATLGHGGAMNMVRIGAASYAWDANPRAQKNGALVGRCYVQQPGEPFRDIGGYKIAPAGEVVEVPAPLLEILAAAPPINPFPPPIHFTLEELEAAP